MPVVCDCVWQALLQISPQGIEYLNLNLKVQAQTSPKDINYVHNLPEVNKKL